MLYYTETPLKDEFTIKISKLYYNQQLNIIIFQVCKQLWESTANYPLQQNIIYSKIIKLAIKNDINGKSNWTFRNDI